MTKSQGGMDRPFLCPHSEHCIRSHYPFIISDLCPLGHWKILSVLFSTEYLCQQTDGTMKRLAVCLEGCTGQVFINIQFDAKTRDQKRP